MRGVGAEALSCCRAAGRVIGKFFTQQSLDVCWLCTLNLGVIVLHAMVRMDGSSF